MHRPHALLKGFIAGLAYALFMGAAFPPVGWWPFVLFAAPALAWGAVAGKERPWRAGLGAALGALPFWVVHHAYVWDITAPGILPLFAYLAFYPGAFVWLLARLVRTYPRLPLAVAVPFLWTGLEVVRGDVVFHGYQWYLAAHPLIEWPLLAKPASIAGTYVVSFLATALGGALLDALLVASSRRRGVVATPPVRSARGVLLSVAMIAATWAGLAALAPDPVTTGSLRIAVVQTNVPQENKIGWTIERRLRDFERFVELTRLAAKSRPQLIAWPETMFPGLALDPLSVEAERRAGLGWTVQGSGSGDAPRTIPSTYFADTLGGLQKELGIPMLVGSLSSEGLRIDRGALGVISFQFDARFNSAFVLDGGAVRPERYDKVALMAFGEEIPYASSWPWLQRKILAFSAAGMSFDLQPGRSTSPLIVPGTAGAAGRDVRIATPICFEAANPDLCRRLVFKGRAGGTERQAAAIVNLTNDGWFGWWDAGREVHLQVSRWRCVELGTPMVRAANTGVSAAVDAGGRVIARGVEGGSARVDGVLTAEVPLAAGVTIYARIGRGFDWLVLAGAVILALGSVRWARGGRATDNRTDSRPTPSAPTGRNGGHT